MPAGKLEFSMKFLTQRIAPRSSTRLLTLNSTILPLWGTGKPRSLYETRASGAMMPLRWIASMAPVKSTVGAP